ncbi:1-acyl-sn-glycerol-3-phosphate acyltransferase [Heliomicrobium modesticaldum Ice1]|uniref:1-acyl-sn-glycerol-3-phosphate acyltransferase n=1 Tax=Heliobacterium modesticaldum (strain ATCC 51547 / Ice1) TaxID=498761 RepID=B0TFQ7_HELMI|nr:lysophospholipid acyltransferase family protein [Heliomicrobium modesticaldum]ABZ84487.1 1-acyl-sn-glycerol-3-phosphate acyltransferase [Heliomicrobium modesticaldum Ice1]
MNDEIRSGAVDLEERERRGLASAYWLYRLLRALFRFPFKHFCHWRISGLENVPLDGPLIVVSNHVSNWDPVILACALPRQLHFMAKVELFKIPVLSYVMTACGAYAVDRGKPGRQALKKSLDILAEDKVICIFPEGTRSKTGETGEAKAGTAMIAAKSQAYILPVGLHNSRKVFSRGWFRPFSVSIGRPFRIEAAEGKRLSSQRLHELSDEIMEEITGLVNHAKEILNKA